MTSITNEQNMNTQSRVIQRRRIDLSSNYVATGIDEMKLMNTDLSYIHNSNIYIINSNSNNRHNNNISMVF